MSRPTWLESHNPLSEIPGTVHFVLLDLPVPVVLVVDPASSRVVAGFCGRELNYGRHYSRLTGYRSAEGVSLLTIGFDPDRTRTVVRLMLPS
jgi:hypothetical protein